MKTESVEDMLALYRLTGSIDPIKIIPSEKWRRSELTTKCKVCGTPAYLDMLIYDHGFVRRLRGFEKVCETCEEWYHKILRRYGCEMSEG